MSRAMICRAIAGLSLLLAGAASAAPGIADAQQATGVPNAVFVPNYGIAYSFGAYPPPGSLVGPDGAIFRGDQEHRSPVVVGVPPYDPSPTSIYAVSSPPGSRCSQVRALAPGAPGVHWTVVCDAVP